MRGRLVAAIVLVAVPLLAASFYALDEGTGADLRGDVDEDLRADVAEFAASPAASSAAPEQLIARGRRFIDEQGYHGDSRIFAIRISGPAGSVITNEPNVLEHDDDDDESEHGVEHAVAGILAAPDGLATIDAPDDEQLRVLTEPVIGSNGRIGTFHVAQSLTPIGSAQVSLRDTLLVVGIATAVVLVFAAFWVATLASRPLRRVASFAADVDTTGLDRRLDEVQGPAEVRSLAHSFNRMLDRLQAAFDREREFVADASHELRTPVTIAQGELDLLRRDAGPQERERLDVVRRELRRMERLVGEMLTLAAEDDADTMRHDRVDVSDLLADVRRDAPLMGQRRYEVAEFGGTVAADPDRLAQVFRNLLRNAVAHTETGGRIEISAEADGGWVRFEIRDDGVGFTDEEAEHLFDRFYRTEGGRSRDAGGLGLGLAIARSIVEAHGGGIRAIPARGGGGAAVKFELPGYRP